MKYQKQINYKEKLISLMREKNKLAKNLKEKFPELDYINTFGNNEMKNIRSSIVNKNKFILLY